MDGTYHELWDRRLLDGFYRDALCRRPGRHRLWCHAQLCPELDDHLWRGRGSGPGDSSDDPRQRHFLDRGALEQLGHPHGSLLLADSQRRRPS